MNFSRVKIVTFVPVSDADIVRKALGGAGAGILGEYSFCSYSVVGKGRFTPSTKATPHIGEVNKPEVVEEERIEVICDKNKAKQVLASLKKAHPYEEIAFDIYPLITENDL